MRVSDQGKGESLPCSPGWDGVRSSSIHMGPSWVWKITSLGVPCLAFPSSPAPAPDLKLLHLAKLFPHSGPQFTYQGIMTLNTETMCVPPPIPDRDVVWCWESLAHHRSNKWVCLEACVPTSKSLRGVAVNTCSHQTTTRNSHLPCQGKGEEGGRRSHLPCQTRLSPTYSPALGRRSPRPPRGM